MDDMNTEKVNSPKIQSSKEPSIKGQNETIAKSPNASISMPLNASFAKPSPRQGSPRRKSSSPNTPPKGSIHTSSIISERSRMDSALINSQDNGSKRPKSPVSIKSENDYSNVRVRSPSIGKSSIQNLKDDVISSSPITRNQKNSASNSPSIKSQDVEQNIETTISHLQPQGKIISKYVNEINETVMELSKSIENSQTPALNSSINKITNMSKILTSEANALRKSIKSLSEDINKTKQELGACREEDINFPYHLFLIELIINKIHMKCECFEFNYDNLVITATFLGKQPIVLYDSSYGKIDNFNRLNVGKSTLFAMTYDKICSIKEFVIHLQINKKPPCSTCVTKLAETYMDYSNEFSDLREELCKKWTDEQPNDNILCTSSTPLSKSMFYLSCCDDGQSDPIGVIEIATRMSFLGKEITTAFNATSKPQGTSFLLKEDHGMSLYSCQKVEMDRHGKILLDEDVLTKKGSLSSIGRAESPISQYSNTQESLKRAVVPRHSPKYQQAGLGEFRIRDLNDEINKLMREKRHWEVQIKALGGPDHARVGPKMLDQDGKEVPGNRGYKYFGAAKDLPGVRELFEQEPPPPPRRTRADLMRDVDADYYGYRDDDDGLLVPFERVAEMEAKARAVEEWKKNKEQNKDQDITEEENIYPEDPEDRRIDDEEEDGSRSIATHVAVPSQKDVEEALLRRKKQELLEQYGCLDVKMEHS